MALRNKELRLKSTLLSSIDNIYVFSIVVTPLFLKKRILGTVLAYKYNKMLPPLAIHKKMNNTPYLWVHHLFTYTLPYKAASKLTVCSHMS